MKKIIISLIIGLIMGFLAGFSIRTIDTVYKLGRQSITNEISQSLQVTGGVPITFNGKQEVLTLTQPTNEESKSD